LLNGYLQSLEDAPSISFKPFRPRRSTHTSYPNEFLKNFQFPSGKTDHSTSPQQCVKSDSLNPPPIPLPLSPVSVRSAHHTSARGLVNDRK